MCKYYYRYIMYIVEVFFWEVKCTMKYKFSWPYFWLSLLWQPVYKQYIFFLWAKNVVS